MPVGKVVPPPSAKARHHFHVGSEPDADRRAWISVSAVKCAIACAHISRFGWHGRRASQAEGSVRSAALNVGRTLGRPCAASRSLASSREATQLGRYVAADQDLRSDGAAGALHDPAGRARRSPVTMRRSAACGEPGRGGNYRARGERWTTVGITRVLTEERPARSLPRREPDRRKTCCPLPGDVSAWQPASVPSRPATGGRSLSRKEGRR